MKYTIDSKNKTIVIQSSFKYEEFLETFKKYEGYKISLDFNYNYTVSVTSPSGFTLN